MQLFKNKFKTKSKLIKAKWEIKGEPDFFFAEDKKLYRLSSKREIKLTLNGYTKGYYMNRKFYSLFRLKSITKKIDI